MKTRSQDKISFKDAPPCVNGLAKQDRLCIRWLQGRVCVGSCEFNHYFPHAFSESDQRATKAWATTLPKK